MTLLMLLAVLAASLAPVKPLLMLSDRLTASGSRVWVHLVECAGVICLFIAISTFGALVATAIMAVVVTALETFR